MKIKLQQILNERNITIYALSKATDISPNNLSKIIKGETTSIKYDNLEKICIALGITPNDIFEIEETNDYDKLINFRYEYSFPKGLNSKIHIPDEDKYLDFNNELESNKSIDIRIPDEDLKAKIRELLNRVETLNQEVKIILDDPYSKKD